MKRKIYKLIAAVLLCIMLTACGEDPEMARFQKDIDDFCMKISEIDTAINSIDASSDADAAVTELLEYLDELDLVFRSFAKLDFPEEFDYLEDTAREAGDYMTTAVKSFHDA